MMSTFYKRMLDALGLQPFVLTRNKSRLKLQD
jgi:hypothetical protein